MQVSYDAAMASGSHPSVSADAPRDPLLGVVLDGRYRLESRLGSGGMAQVYRAEQLKLGRPVAVKVLHANFTGDPDLHARFEREARALARVNHEHILHAYDHGVTDDGRLYLVTELLSGHTLHRLIGAHKDRRMPLPAAVAILRQLACALEAVHDFLVHRDLKPHNVIVDTSHGLKAKLLDFGIVRPTVGSELTSRGIIGTPSYMSPEQIEQEVDLDARSDLYSLGIMAFELLTGDVPFRSRKQIEVLSAHLTRLPPPVDEVVPDVCLPEPLTALVAQLLEKDRERRPASAVELRVRLEAIEAEFDGAPAVLAAVPPGPPAPMAITPGPPVPSSPSASLARDVRAATAHLPSPTASEFLSVPTRRGPILAVIAAGFLAVALLGYGLVRWRSSPVEPLPEVIRSDSRRGHPESEKSTTSLAPEEPTSSGDEASSGKSTAQAPEEPEPTPEEAPPRARRPAERAGGAAGAQSAAAPSKRVRSRVQTEASRPELKKPSKPPAGPSRRASDAIPPSSEAPERPSSQATSGEAVVTARTLTGRQPIIEVSWRGRVIGQGAKVRVELPPGTHELEVRRAGATGRSRTRKVRIRAGDTTQAKVLLD